MTRACAFVFARGGSKGLPRKNILPIAGLPLLVHGIRVAQAIESISAIYVSTDCDEIASVAKRAGAEIIPRPPELASDDSPEWLSWQHAINYVFAHYGPFDVFLSLPATAPLRHTEDVHNCLNALKHDVDFVVTTSSANRSPWFNMVKKNDAGFVELLCKDVSIHRRQDAPQCFDMTTVAYVAKTSFILQCNSIWDGNVVGIEIPAERALDIDTPLDFAIAKFLMENKNSLSFFS